MNSHPSDPLSHEKIAERAHQLWRERGQPEGRDQEHWLEAERQLRGGQGSPAAATGRQGSIGADKRLDGLVQPKPGPARRTPKGEQL